MADSQANSNGKSSRRKSNAKKADRGRFKTITGRPGFRTRRKDVVTKTPINADESDSPAQSDWSLWHTFRALRLKKYRGKFFYKIPIFNFFYGFYDIENDPPEWEQLTSLLNVLAIVTALLLALVCTFYSTVDFEETASAELRYSWGVDHADHPAYRHADAATRFNARYLEIRSPSCFGPTASQACIDEWQTAGNNVSLWSAAVANVTAVVEGSPYYPWCRFPCYADRPYTGDDMATSFTSGNYALSWVLRRVVLVSGDAAETAMEEGKHLNREDICGEDKTEDGWQCYHNQSPMEEFINFSTWCAAFLSFALLLAVLVLGTGSANPFAREQDNGGFSYQYRSVTRAYLYWVRFVNLGIIWGTILGTILFIQALKAMVYVKYTDIYIEEKGYYGAFGFYFGMDSPYAFVNTATIWIFYLPIFAGAIILSVSTAMLNSTPAHSTTDMNNVRTMTLAARRKAHADDLADFLEFVGQLPRFRPSSLDANGLDPVGPRLGCYGKDKGFRTDIGITLKGAGGQSSYEAESVADALIDAGIYDVRTLCRVLLHDQLGGLGQMPPLYGMSALTPGAVLCVMLGVRRFAAVNATDEPAAAESEEAEVRNVRVPADHMAYVTSSYNTNTGSTAIPTLPDVWADYPSGGWKQKSADKYVVYERKCVADSSSKAVNAAKIHETAKLKIDCVILWWMEKLKTMSVEHSNKKYVARPRIPDAELFPNEHLAVEKWLLDERNAHKDGRLAMIELATKENPVKRFKPEAGKSYPEEIEINFEEPKKKMLSMNKRKEKSVKMTVLKTSPFLPEEVQSTSGM